MERDTPTIMPWGKFVHVMLWSTSTDYYFAEQWSLGDGASAVQLVCGYLALEASGRERLVVLEWAGRASLTWAHGAVVAGSLLTQWPAALRAVRG